MTRILNRKNIVILLGLLVVIIIVASKDVNRQGSNTLVQKDSNLQIQNLVKSVKLDQLNVSTQNQNEKNSYYLN